MSEDRGTINEAHYASEKLTKAIGALAMGEGHLRERCTAAYRELSHRGLLEDFEGEFRDRFEFAYYKLKNAKSEDVSIDDLKRAVDVLLVLKRDVDELWSSRARKDR